MRTLVHESRITHEHCVVLFFFLLSLDTRVLCAYEQILIACSVSALRCTLSWIPKKKVVYIPKFYQTNNTFSACECSSCPTKKNSIAKGPDHC